MPKCRYVAKVVPHWPDLGGTFATRLVGTILEKKNAKNPKFFVFFWGRCKSYPKKKTDHIEDNGVPS